MSKRPAASPGVYDPRLVLTRRTYPPQPGTPEANPSATLIEPKVPDLSKAEQPSRWATVSAAGAGRRGPKVVVALPRRTRLLRRSVGEADRYAGGTVHGSPSNRGWRWHMQLWAGVFAILEGLSVLLIALGLGGLL